MRALVLIPSLFFTLVPLAVLRAGGGPESTLLVVNARSPLSRIVAREYRELRRITSYNVCYTKLLRAARPPR